MKRKIYLATSWKNLYFSDVLARLKMAGHEVYNFRQDGFGWSEVDPNWQERFHNHAAYLRALEHPRAIDGFNKDFAAMQWADTGVLLTPCGRSAHLELGWMIADGKETVILLTDPQEWDLMYKLAGKIVLNLSDLIQALD